MRAYPCSRSHAVQALIHDAVSRPWPTRVMSGGARSALTTTTTTRRGTCSATFSRGSSGTPYGSASRSPCTRGRRMRTRSKYSKPRYPQSTRCVPAPTHMRSDVGNRHDTQIHVHCFTDAPDFAQRLLDHFANLYIGITGACFPHSILAASNDLLPCTRRDHVFVQREHLEPRAPHVRTVARRATHHP